MSSYSIPDSGLRPGATAKTRQTNSVSTKLQHSAELSRYPVCDVTTITILRTFMGSERCLQAHLSWTSINMMSVPFGLTETT